jgi:hypothetical protein
MRVAEAADDELFALVKHFWKSWVYQIKCRIIQKLQLLPAERAMRQTARAVRDILSSALQVSSF